MSSLEVWKPTKDETPTFVDKKCGSDNVWYLSRESYCGGYDILYYECRNCGRKWRAVFGDDS
jgi:DNA-directed RNA polymerase subunit M/transcription elongation factor TFIIS